jgi:hypothetical protein
LKYVEDPGNLHVPNDPGKDHIRTNQKKIFQNTKCRKHDHSKTMGGIDGFKMESMFELLKWILEIIDYRPVEMGLCDDVNVFRYESE